MAVYFKFASAKDYESLSIDGTFVSVADLKRMIIAKKKLSQGPKDFFDVLISNPQTREEYTDEASSVPTYTSVLVRRIPRASNRIAAGSNDSQTILQVKSRKGPAFVPVNSFVPKVVPTPAKHRVENFATNDVQAPALDRVTPDTPENDDDFGFDFFAIPTPIKSRPENEANENDRIKALVEASSLERQQQSGETSWPGRNVPLQREYRQGFDKKVPHSGYVCHRCGVAGHFIQNCPTNGDKDYDKKKIRQPTGIPRSMLDVDPEGTYFLPTGQVAVIKPSESVFEREVNDFLPSAARQIVDIPAELRCPLCKEVLKDAVLTSKCCFKSYCDKCIRNQIISKAKCACGATKVLADDLLPNRTLRDAIDRLLDASQWSCITSSHNSESLLSPAVSSHAIQSDTSDLTIELGARGKHNVQQNQAAAVKQRMQDDDSVQSRAAQAENLQQPITGMKKAPAKRVLRDDMVYGMQYTSAKVPRTVY